MDFRYHYFCLTSPRIPFQYRGRAEFPRQVASMHKRKHIIDKKFQLRTTFRIIGIIIIAFMLIIAVTGIVSMDNNRKITATINDLNRAMERDRRAVETLIASAGTEQNRGRERDHDRIIEDHLESMALMHTNIGHLKKILGQNRILVTVMICTGILLGTGLFVYLIRLTGRMSGPLYVLKQHMHDIMNGRKPNLHKLRKNDEFQEFYREFISFIERLSNR